MNLVLSHKEEADKTVKQMVESLSQNKKITAEDVAQLVKMGLAGSPVQRRNSIKLLSLIRHLPLKGNPVKNNTWSNKIMEYANESLKKQDKLT